MAVSHLIAIPPTTTVDNCICGIFLAPIMHLPLFLFLWLATNDRVAVESSAAAGRSYKIRKQFYKKKQKECAYFGIDN